MEYFNAKIEVNLFGKSFYSISGLIPLPRNFSLRTHVKFTRVNEIEAMYERPRVNVKGEGGSTFTFTRDLS